MPEWRTLDDARQSCALRRPHVAGRLRPRSVLAVHRAQGTRKQVRVSCRDGLYRCPRSTAPPVVPCAAVIGGSLSDRMYHLQRISQGQRLERARCPAKKIDHVRASPTASRTAVDQCGRRHGGWRARNAPGGASTWPRPNRGTGGRALWRYVSVPRSAGASPRLSHNAPALARSGPSKPLRSDRNFTTRLAMRSNCHGQCALRLVPDHGQLSLRQLRAPIRQGPTTTPWNFNQRTIEPAP